MVAPGVPSVLLVVTVMRSELLTVSRVGDGPRSAAVAIEHQRRDGPAPEVQGSCHEAVLECLGTVGPVRLTVDPDWLKQVGVAAAVTRRAPHLGTIHVVPQLSHSRWWCPVQSM